MARSWSARPCSPRYEPRCTSRRRDTRSFPGLYFDGKSGQPCSFTARCSCVIQYRGEYRLCRCMAKRSPWALSEAQSVPCTNFPSSFYLFFFILFFCAFPGFLVLRTLELELRAQVTSRRSCIPALVTGKPFWQGGYWVSASVHFLGHELKSRCPHDNKKIIALRQGKETVAILFFIE